MVHQARVIVEILSNAARGTRRFVMQTAAESNVCATQPWVNPRLIHVVVFLLTMVCIVHGESAAQGLLEDPDERFSSLQKEDRYSLDAARIEVAERFGSAIAVDIAVYLCSPDPDPSCKDSRVLRTWDDFLDQIFEDRTVAQVAQDMLLAGADEDLVAGIAVYWCSPEPGFGCGDDLYTQAWSDFYSLLDDDPNPADAVSVVSELHDPFVAELIGASECGHPTCYADEIAELYSDDVELPDQLKHPPPPQEQAKQQPASEPKYGYKGSKVRDWKQKFCKILKRC